MQSEESFYETNCEKVRFSNLCQLLDVKKWLKLRSETIKNAHVVILSEQLFFKTFKYCQSVAKQNLRFLSVIYCILALILVVPLIPQIEMHPIYEGRCWQEDIQRTNTETSLMRIKQDQPREILTRKYFLFDETFCLFYQNVLPTWEVSHRAALSGQTEILTLVRWVIFPDWH